LNKTNDINMHKPPTIVLALNGDLITSASTNATVGMMGMGTHRKVKVNIPIKPVIVFENEIEGLTATNQIYPTVQRAIAEKEEILKMNAKKYL
ncbi:2243_t:CDS:2, partial [Racocetra fulgida]